MFCAYCGTQLQDHARFCVQCGQKVMTPFENTENVQPEANPTPVTEEKHQAESNSVYLQKMLKNYEDAKASYEKEDAEDVLNKIRTALECLVKHLLTENDYPVQGSLEDMINVLGNTGVATKSQRDRMQSIRFFGNKGHHATTEEVPLETAYIQLDSFSIVLESYGLDCLQADQDAKAPKTDPQYFSKDRPYRGEWANVYTREGLLSIPNYVQLYRKAEQGDVQAMLDIAAGFLGREIYWGKHEMVIFPPYRAYGQEFAHEDIAYDYRYYYWIMKAAVTASWKPVEQLPDYYVKHYMLSSAMEALKFAYHSCGFHGCRIVGVSGRKNPVTGNYDNVYEYEDQVQLIQNMFQDNTDNYLTGIMQPLFAKRLFEYLEAENNREIVCSVFREHTKLHAQYIYYCLKYLVVALGGPDPDPASVTITLSHMAIRPEDLQRQVTYDMLESYSSMDEVTMDYFKFTCDTVNEQSQNLKYENHDLRKTLHNLEKEAGDFCDRIFGKANDEVIDKLPGDNVVKALDRFLDRWLPR